MSEVAASDVRQADERRRLFTTFGYLVGKQGAVAVLGLMYWFLATRLFSTEDVGLAAAAASIAAFIGALGVLGIPVLLLAELKSVDSSSRRLVYTTGMAVACLVVLVLCLVALAMAPEMGRSLRIIASDPVTALLFVAGAIGTVATLTFDNTAIGLHRGSAQLTRGIISAVLKVACVGFLVLAGVRTSAGLLFAWGSALIVSLIVARPMLRFERARRGEGGIRRRVALVRRYGRLSLNHHVLNLSINSISYIVPLIAALLIAPRQVAFFTTAFLLSASVLIIPYLLALSLFAEKAKDPELLHRHIRRTLPVGLALCSAIVVGVEVFAPFVLRVFGPAYAQNGTTAMRLLILVGPAYVIKDHYVAIRRAQGQLTRAARVMAAGTSAEAVGAVVGGVLWGMNGLCIGWTVAATCEAIALLPPVMEVYLRAPQEDARHQPQPL
jgi:O-antigen/teichoic acid export membrane protein